MTTNQTMVLPDVQSSVDARNIAITRVGVRGITLPVVIETQTGVQHSIAQLRLTVSLPADKKGTHMSRFIALMEEYNTKPLNPTVMHEIMTVMLERLHAQRGTIKIHFPFFVKKVAPVSKLESTMNYQAAWIVDCHNEQITVSQETIVPVTSLCPCSKEISQYGAHNQRSSLRSRVTLHAPLSLEEQIKISETSASCQLWSRLKRADEKYVTEYAYDNPKFVEDLVRDMANAMQKDSRINDFFVEAENFESIHNHSAYAYIDSKFL